MTKALARQQAKAKRMALSYAEIDKMQDLMLIQFQALHLPIPDVVMTYAPLEKFNEYDPALIVDHCSFKNPAVQICYPVIDETTTGLVAVKTHIDAAFAENSFGIEEPVNGQVIPNKEVEMVFVPLLAFDEAGNRVGYGKGFYDKFLQACHPGTVKIGFSFFTALPELIASDDWDVPLDYCITPLHNYIF